MNKYQAIFVIGYPGSGKDIVIRDICSNYNITEFTSSKLDDMLSNSTFFKNSTEEKKDSLLERKSIIVTANAFNLNFVITKQILEDIGYTSHLIFVETDLKTAYDRLKSRKDLKESLEKINVSNSNKHSIFSLFDSNVVVNNSHILDLSESRTFVFDILNEFSFKSTLTLDDILEEKKQKKKSNIKKSGIPQNFFDGLGDSQTGGWTDHMESFDEPSYNLSPIATGPMQNIDTSTADMRSDQDKQRSKKLLTKIQKIKKLVIPQIMV